MGLLKYHLIVRIIEHVKLPSHIYLSMKQDNLFCFVMLRFFLIFLESSQWVGVYQLDFKLFGTMVWKLLIIETFFQEKLNKIKTEKIYWNLTMFLVSLKIPWWVKFNRFYFTIFIVEEWKIVNFEWILLLEIQTNCKNWVWKENFVEPSMFYTYIFNKTLGYNRIYKNHNKCNQCLIFCILMLKFVLKLFIFNIRIIW